MRWMLSAVLIGLLATTACAQDARRAVFVDSAPRQYLASEWNPRDAYQPERGYCAAYTIEITPDSVILFHVTKVVPGNLAYADQGSSLFHCPPFGQWVMVHTHPPSTCEKDQYNRLNCTLGGMLAYECFPSDADQRVLLVRGDAFALVQCDEHALVPYFPPKSVLSVP